MPPAAMLAGMDTLTRSAHSALNLLLPPLCLRCDTPVERQGTLCGSCFAQLHFIHDPLCVQCGTPFELPMDPGTRCGDCEATPPRWRMARSIWRYDAASRPLITRLKYADQSWLAPWLGGWLARIAAPLIEQADYITPVPLHARRLWWRGFNQSVLLGRMLEKESGTPLIPDLLCRTKSTPPQAGLTQRQRRINVRAAFAVREAWQERIKGRRILLVDDVLTTGATVDACAKALLKAEAASVDVVTVARVCR